jgi:hypothetical protein
MMSLLVEVTSGQYIMTSWAATSLIDCFCGYDG